MRILYAFPHPDDEAYGPSRAMAAQRRSGHDVFLLTLTRGEATSVRQKFGWTLDEMGAARYREMLDVAKVLDLAGMKVLNFPDGKLKELDPWSIESAVREEILRVRPHVVVTFPVHGLSGFHDHIITHTTVTRTYLEMRGPERPWLQRLAYFTLVTAPESFPWHVNVTKPEEIDCAFEVTDAEMRKYHEALDCYVTYAEVIARTNIHEYFREDVYFEIFREDHKPPLSDLCAGLAPDEAGN
jgi:LmbE family N-acetylglucosaminyl deacetylase